MTAAADAGLAGGPQSSAGAPIGPSAAAMFPHFQTIDRSEISLKRLIGSGAYGKVRDWRGAGRRGGAVTWRQGRDTV